MNIPYHEVRIKHTVLGVPSNRTEQQIEANAEYYLWRIYIDGLPESLQKIDHVEYHLGPSFPTPSNRHNCLLTDHFGRIYKINYYYYHM